MECVFVCVSASPWSSSSSLSSPPPASPSTSKRFLQPPPLHLPPFHSPLRASKPTTDHWIERRRVVGARKTSLTDAPLRAQAESIIPAGYGPDLFVLDLAEKLEESVSAEDTVNAAAGALSKLRERSAEAALGFQWPSNKVEAYRFTDLRFLKKANIQPSLPPSDDLHVDLSGLELAESACTRIVFIDGVLSNSHSNVEGLPDGVVVASITALSDEKTRDQVLPKLGESAEWINGDIFASLNGIGAPDIGVIHISEGVKFQGPLHVVYYSSQGGTSAGDEHTYVTSCPRLLVVVEKGAVLDLVEEFVGEAGKVYWTNSVLEIWIAEEGKVVHSYIQNQEREAVQIKQTCIAQGKASSYKLVEAGIGGKLSRHNLEIQQLGPDTLTEVSTFLLAGQNQLQDLHSRLILSHPRGYGRQLHKCIVMHSSGHSVFDGNIKVNRYAQQTDAGQLSRSLLLAPRATVNIKPNLQIIADDVKCSHGAAISDLEEEQLFYFQARGIDPQTARAALVFSFGAEVLERLEYKSLQKRVESTVKKFLAAEGAIQSNIQLGVGLLDEAVPTAD